MYYLNLDADGYLLSIFQTDAGAPDGTPSIESLEGFDFAGERIGAFRWDGEALTFDEAKHAAILAAIPPEPEAETPLADRVTALEEENAVLTGQLTDTQLALCDVYEQMLAAAGEGV